MKYFRFYLVTSFFVLSGCNGGGGSGVGDQGSLAPPPPAAESISITEQVSGTKEAGLSDSDVVADIPGVEQTEDGFTHITTMEATAEIPLEVPSFEFTAEAQMELENLSQVEFFPHVAADVEEVSSSSTYTGFSMVVKLINPQQCGKLTLTGVTDTFKVILCPGSVSIVTNVPLRVRSADGTEVSIAPFEGGVEGVTLPTTIQPTEAPPAREIFVIRERAPDFEISKDGNTVCVEFFQEEAPAEIGSTGVSGDEPTDVSPQISLSITPSAFQQAESFCRETYLCCVNIDSNFESEVVKGYALTIAIADPSKSTPDEIKFKFGDGGKTYVRSQQAQAAPAQLAASILQGDATGEKTTLASIENVTVSNEPGRDVNVVPSTLTVDSSKTTPANPSLETQETPPQILGRVDGIDPVVTPRGTVGIRVWGWTCEYGNSEPIGVKFRYVDKETQLFVSGKTSEDEVRNSCGVTSGNYRFEETIDLYAMIVKGVKIRVYGQKGNSEEVELVNSKQTINKSADIKGEITSATFQDNKLMDLRIIQITGWSCVKELTAFIGGPSPLHKSEPPILVKGEFAVSSVDQQNWVSSYVPSDACSIGKRFEFTAKIHRAVSAFTGRVPLYVYMYSAKIDNDTTSSELVALSGSGTIFVSLNEISTPIISRALESIWDNRLLDFKKKYPIKLFSNEGGVNAALGWWNNYGDKFTAFYNWAKSDGCAEYAPENQYGNAPEYTFLAQYCPDVRIDYPTRDLNKSFEWVSPTYKARVNTSSNDRNILSIIYDYPQEPSPYGCGIELALGNRNVAGIGSARIIESMRVTDPCSSAMIYSEVTDVDKMKAISLFLTRQLNSTNTTGLMYLTPLHYSCGQLGGLDAQAFGEPCEQHEMREAGDVEHRAYDMAYCCVP